MRAYLLITWKNGSSAKTYGVSPHCENIMKFTFICLVILICSVCASGDLEIFPGYKYGESPDDYRHRLIRTNDDTFYGGWPWQKLQLNDYKDRKEKIINFDFDGPAKYGEFEDFTDKNTNQPEKDDEMPYYFNAKQRFQQAYENFKNFRELENDKFKDPFQIHSNPMLSDVRPYPQEDDFSFQSEDDTEEPVSSQSIRNPPHETLNSVASKFGYPDVDKFYDYQMMQDNKKNKQRHVGHHEEASGKGALEDSKEASGRGILENAKLVDDPTEFAYAPPDPRFYEPLTVTESKSEKPTKFVIERFGKKQREKPFVVNHRSDDSLHQQTINSAEKAQQLQSDVSIERVPDPPGEIGEESASAYIIAVVAGISAAATVGLVAVGVLWYKLQKHVKNASDVEYPAYGVTGPNKDVSPSGDRKLAQSAQMYHYQHQKQQIVAMESRAAGERQNSNSEGDSDEENEEGDYTVYECPGLAPTGEMEVKNPLFQDDQTPMEGPQVKIGEEDNQK